MMGLMGTGGLRSGGSASAESASRADLLGVPRRGGELVATGKTQHTLTPNFERVSQAEQREGERRRRGRCQSRRAFAASGEQFYAQNSCSTVPGISLSVS